MKPRYISVPHENLGSGIDALSPEDSIGPGFSESLVNWDATPEGSIKTRTGYQRALGNIPVRVSRLIYDASGSMTFQLDSSVDLSSIASQFKSRPIIIRGRTSSANADNAGSFPTDQDTALYFDTFNADNRKTLNEGSDTLTIPASEHGLSGSTFLVGLALSLDPSNKDNAQFMPDALSIDQVSDELTVDYTNDTGSNQSAFVYYYDCSPTAGINYVSGVTAVATGTSTVTITAATHGLSNQNIYAKVYEDTGSEYRELIPDSVTVASNGDVTVELTNSSADPIDVLVLLTRANVENTATGTAAAGESVSISIESPEAPFLFVSCYLESGTDKEQVIPDSVIYDEATDTTTVTFTNGSGVDASFYVHWIPSPIATNSLIVAAGEPIASGFTDNQPQLTIWGLDHEGLYESDTPRGGWVTHLDIYKSEGEEFLVAGLGGNLFKGQEATSATQSDYLMGSLFTNLRRRVSGSSICGPTFLTTGEESFRTRGHLVGDSVENGVATAQTVEWDEATGYVKLILEIPGLTVDGTLADIISTTEGLEDRATVTGAGFRVHEGTFPIKQVDVTGETLTLWVDNPSVTSSDFDDAGSGTQVAIYTDRVTLDGASPFIPGDSLLTEPLNASSADVTCLASEGTTLLMAGVTVRVSFANGLRIGAARTSSVIPLREEDGTSSVENFVGGDMLTLTGFARQFRLVNVNTQDDVSVDVTGDGETATATLGSGDTTRMVVGDQYLLTQAGPYSGAVTVTAIPSTDTFQFAHTSTETTSGTLKGKTVTVDEEFEWQDNGTAPVSVSVSGRWVPIEAPDDSFDLTPSTYVQHLSESMYEDQPFLRSVMANASMYLTNGEDRPLKFDGSSLYRPGLIRWQPHLFVTAATSPGSGGTVTLNTRSCAFTAISGNKFTVSLADEKTFPVGTRIADSIDSAIYTVTDTSNDGTSAYIAVERDITSSFTGTPTLTETCTLSYYFRLNAVDANGYLVASAAVGSEDFQVELTADAQVRIRLVGLPALDIYDYDRLEVEIYRTKRNQVAPFYRLATIPLSFNNGQGYIDYADTDSDDDLSDLDAVMTPLKGAELGTAWSQPLRAKRITSTSNRLVLANLKGDPQVDLQLYDTGSRITASALSGLKFTLRKDNTSSSTTTDMSNVVNFEFVTSGDIAASVAVGTEEFTVTATSHGLVEGDWVYLFRQAAPDVDQGISFMGWWQVASAPTADTFTVNWLDVPASITASKEIDRLVKATSGKDVPVYLGQDYGYGTRFGNKSTTGPYESVATKRLANAVNTTQRMVDASLSGYESFRPWIVADAGGEFSTGQLILRQPIESDTTFELVLPSSFSGFSIFANGVRRSASEQVSARAQLFGSRILASYKNFPEIFDNPTALVDSDSDSAVDVNPSDGQDLTAVIPFFGDSAFGSSQQDGVLVAFKANSIYLVNLAEKEAGRNPLQRIESQGLGCTAPRSVCPVKGGILFANNSGVYRLGHDLQVTYVGRRLQRLWREQVNQDVVDMVHVGNWSFNNQVNVSVPYGEEETPTQALVYNSTREYAADGFREGSWVRYSNLPAIGWANQEVKSYFASTDGRVYVRRDTGEETDSRDDDAPIVATADLRAMDFGDDGVRKTVSNAVISFRTPEGAEERTGVTVSYAKDLSDTFEPADTTVLPAREDDGRRGVSLRYSFSSGRCNRFQLRIEHSQKDRSVEVTKIRYRVAGLTQQGVREAKSITASDS